MNDDTNFIEDDQTQHVNTIEAVDPKSKNVIIRESVMTKHSLMKSSSFLRILLGLIIGGLLIETWMQSDIAFCNKNREFEMVARTTAITKNQKLPKGKKRTAIKPLSKALCYKKTTPLVETRKLFNQILAGIKKP
jgi:hypothetical protein